MTYYVPQEMAEDQRLAFVEWAKQQFEDPNTIAVQKLAVHNGRVSGFQFVLNDKGERIVGKRHKDYVEFLKVPFNIPQTVPLPEGF